MSTNKQFRSTSHYFLMRFKSITIRITTNVCKQHRHLLAMKKLKLTQHYITQITTVHIAINSPQRFHCSQLIVHLFGTDVAGMPYFVALVSAFITGISSQPCVSEIILSFSCILLFVAFCLFSRPLFEIGSKAFGSRFPTAVHPHPLRGILANYFL